MLLLFLIHGLRTKEMLAYEKVPYHYDSHPHYGIYWAFFDIQRIDGQEILKEVDSPGGINTVIVYLNNGGATTDYAVLCTVKNNQTGRKRNIYWQYQCMNAYVRWIDDDTVVINTKELDVWEDSYDYRND